MKIIIIIATKMAPELQDLTYEERLKEMQLTVLQLSKEEKEETITINQLMSN